MAFELFKDPKEVGFKSKTLNNVIYALPQMREPVRKLLAKVDVKQAEEGYKDEMWVDPEMFSKIDEIKTVSDVPFFQSLI